MKILKKFHGHSGSSIFLVEKGHQSLVYKTPLSNARQCAEILEKLPFDTPKIEEVGDRYLVMEYIPGVTMKTYLKYATIEDVKKLTNFLIEYVEFSISSSIEYNFKNEIDKKFESFKNYVNIDYLVPTIPTVLPKGTTHGDLTLENILYYNNRFYFIDAHYTDLNSIVFDVNKLRQDLQGMWFVREEQDNINYLSSCNIIYKNLNNHFKDLFNDSVYGFMMARILPYCKRDLERNLILKEIRKCE